MGEFSFAVSVTHAPWISERVKSMARLRDALGHGCAAYCEETERAPWWIWSEKQWRWGAAQDTSHVVFLQDDAMLAPVFWPALQAMLGAHPHDLIALHCPHPGAMKLAREGVRWCSTADGLVGLGYVFPRLLLADDFLDWRGKALVPGGASHPAISEDSLINIWCVSTGQHIFHPIPTIVDHDVSIRSTNGYDDHAYRRPRVLWSDGAACGWTDDELTKPEFWQANGRSISCHLGRVYAKTHWAAKLVVSGFSRFYEVESDTCPPEYARFFTCQ